MSTFDVELHVSLIKRPDHGGRDSAPLPAMLLVHTNMYKHTVYNHIRQPHHTEPFLEGHGPRGQSSSEDMS